MDLVLDDFGYLIGVRVRVRVRREHDSSQHPVGLAFMLGMVMQ